MIKFDWKTGIIPLVFTVMLIILNINVPPLPGDDFVYSLKFEEQNYPGTETIKSFKDYFHSQVNHYNTYNNRVLPHALLQAFLLLPSLVFDLLNTIIFLLLPILLLRPFDHIDPKEKYYLYFSSLALIWLFHPAFGNAYLWTAGSVNYTWTLIPQIYFVGSLFLLYSKARPLKFLDVVSSFFIASSNEHILCTISIFAIISIAKLYSERKNLDKHLLISLIIMCSGGLFMLLSPALFERFKNGGTEEIVFGKLVFENLKRTVVYLIALLTTAILLLGYSRIKSKNAVFFFSSMIGLSFLIMIFTPLFEPRAAVFPYFMSFMLLYSVIDHRTGKSHLILFLLLALSTFTFNGRFAKANKLNKKMKVLENKIKSAERNDTIYTSRICVQSFAPKIPCQEISQNPDNLQNLSLARFFNKAAIKSLSPERNWDTDSDGNIDQSIRQRIKGRQLNQKTHGDKFLDSLYYYYKEGKLEILIKVSEENMDLNHRVIARAQRRTLEHYLLSWIPIKYRLYLLDFIEEDFDISRLNQRGYFAIEVDKPALYDYLLFSLYDKEEHQAFGETTQWIIPLQ